MRDATTHDDAPVRFMGWRDLTITPAVWVVLLAAALVPALQLRAHFGWGGLTTALVAYVLLVADTVLFLGLLRRLFPWAYVPGVYVASREPWRCYLGSHLYGFLFITNLALPCGTGVIPPPLRSLFYRLLGARIGKGIVPIGGRVADPHLIEIGAGVMIGDDALVLSHGVNTVGGKEVLVLAKVTIGDGAIIGARTVIMPGVTVGANAMVAAMSFVAMGTVIPPGETWGGYPAKKLSGGRPLPSKPAQPVIAVPPECSADPRGLVAVSVEGAAARVHLPEAS